nr:hypothetical protein [Kineosporia succinea]
MAEQARLKLMLEQLVPSGKLTRSDIASLLDQMGSFAQRLQRADPRDRADLYMQLGLRLRCDPSERLVKAVLDPDPCTYESVRGGT